MRSNSSASARPNTSAEMASASQCTPHRSIPSYEIAAIPTELGNRGAQKRIEASPDRGAPDNVTVVLVYASEPTMLVLAGEGSAR